MELLLHNQFIVVAGALLIPLAGLVSYYDVRYRRIPNRLALATLACGIVMNTLLGGTSGLLSSLGGLVAAFVLMLVMHIFGAMGAGDVKLFGAIGSVVGLSYVLPTFLVVLMTGGACARWAEEFLAAYPGVQLDKPFSTEDVEQVLELVG